MTSASRVAARVNGPAAASGGDHRIGPERIAELLAVADAASMALQVLEEAARSAREDLQSVLRSVTAIDEQRRAAGAAARALDDGGPAPPSTCAPWTGSPRRPADRWARRARHLQPRPPGGAGRSAPGHGRAGRLGAVVRHEGPSRALIGHPDVVVVETTDQACLARIRRLSPRSPHRGRQRVGRPGLPAAGAGLRGHPRRARRPARLNRAPAADPLSEAARRGTRRTCARRRRCTGRGPPAWRRARRTSRAARWRRAPDAAVRP